MLMISAFLPLLFTNLPPVIRSHHIWTFLWFVSLITLKTEILTKRAMFYLIIYGAIMLLLLLNTIWINIDPWNKMAITKEFYEVTVAISVMVYFRLEKDYIGLANLVKWTLIFVMITGVMSIITSIINPMYARDIIGLSDVSITGERELILSYKKYGGGNYGFASGIICLFPMFIFYYKNIGKSYWDRRILILFTIIIFFALIRMQIFANILISVVIITLSLAGSKKLLRSVILITLLTGILFIIPKQFYINTLVRIGSWFDPNSDVYFKFNDMANFLTIGGGYEGTGTGERASRYPLLWDSFISNPIYGGKDFNGHLHWMNKLAVFGLLGTLPFLWIVAQQIRTNLKIFDKEFSFYFLLSMLSIIALGCIKALGGKELWYMYFIIIPGFYYIPLLKKEYQPQFQKKHSDIQEIQYNN
jgi:hypothetical protein